EAGLAFSTEGKARAGMGVDTGDFDGSGKSGIAITNFDNEMIGLYRATAPGVFDDVSIPSGIGAASRNTLGFGCIFLDIDLDGALRSEEHTSELQSRVDLVCRLLPEKKQT